MAFPLPVPEPLRQVLKPGTGVLLGISGGVDSAVALAVLQELGCDVQCVTFKNFCHGDEDIVADEQSCCSLDAIEDAGLLARRFGARHWVHSVEEFFRQNVIDPFIQDYADAMTPNPCLACNSEVRFPEFVRLARRQGCSFAATGHYARVVHGEKSPRLLRGLDLAKDQSYFLGQVPGTLFSEVVFPLGWWTKPQVRMVARELGIPMAEKKDSQEICFVPDGDRAFLFGDGKATCPGPIVDRQGKELGRHRGLIHYTVGQRRGLGVAAPEPLYVLSLDLEASRLVVGYRDELAVNGVRADGFRWAMSFCPEESLAGNQGLVARLRHRHAGAVVQDWKLDAKGHLELKLAGKVDGAAPGQGLVLYLGDEVVGAGRITGSFSWADRSDSPGKADGIAGEES